MSSIIGHPSTAPFSDAALSINCPRGHLPPPSRRDLVREKRERERVSDEREERGIEHEIIQRE